MVIVNGGGGGGGPASGSMVIMPANPVITISNVNDSGCTITWEEPYHEIPIAEYKIYHSTVSPSSINDMYVLGSVPYTTKTFTATGLYPGIKHYFVVTSVGSNEYENASIEHIKSVVTKSAYTFCVYGFYIGNTSGVVDEPIGVPEFLLTNGPRLCTISNDKVETKNIPIPIKSLPAAMWSNNGNGALSTRAYFCSGAWPLLVGQNKGWAAPMAVRTFYSGNSYYYSVFGYWACDPYGENTELHVFHDSADSTISGYSTAPVYSVRNDSLYNAITGDTEDYMIFIILDGATTGLVYMVPKGKSATKQILVKTGIGRANVLNKWDGIGNTVRVGQDIYCILSHYVGSGNVDSYTGRYFGCLHLDNVLGASWRYEPVDLGTPMSSQGGYASFFGLVNGHMLLSIYDPSTGGMNRTRFYEIANYQTNPTLVLLLTGSSQIPSLNGDGTTINYNTEYHGFTFIFYRDGYYYAYYNNCNTSSSAKLPIYRSTDLINWSYYGSQTLIFNNGHSGRQTMRTIDNKVISTANRTGSLYYSSDLSNYVVFSQSQGYSSGGQNLATNFTSNSISDNIQ